MSQIDELLKGKTGAKLEFAASVVFDKSAKGTRFLGVYQGAADFMLNNVPKKAHQFDYVSAEAGVSFERQKARVDVKPGDRVSILSGMLNAILTTSHIGKTVLVEYKGTTPSAKPGQSDAKDLTVVVYP